MPMNKAGVVFMKKFEDAFDPFNDEMVLAYFIWKQTNRWPEGFTRNYNIWFSPGWMDVVEAKLKEFPPSREVRGYMEEFERVKGIVDKIHFPGYEFIVEPYADGYSIQIKYNEPDVMTGVDEDQIGRRWAFPAQQTAGQIVQTAFKALLTSLEHRAREHFTWKGKAVLQPHMDIRDIWDMLPAQNIHKTEIVFSH